MYVCVHVTECVCMHVHVYEYIHAYLCMHVSMCLYVCVCGCMCVYACIMCVLLCVCVHACCVCMHAYMCMHACVHVCMHACVCCVYVCMSLGSKHPFPNIFCEIFFTPNPPNLSQDTCQYLSWTMHAHLYTFKALIKSAQVKKPKSPESKHWSTNTCWKKCFYQNPPNIPQLTCYDPHPTCMHSKPLLELSKILIERMTKSRNMLIPPHKHKISKCKKYIYGHILCLQVHWYITYSWIRSHSFLEKKLLMHFGKPKNFTKTAFKKILWYFSTNYFHSKTLLHIPQHPGKVNEPSLTGIWGKNVIKIFGSLEIFTKSSQSCLSL